MKYIYVVIALVLTTALHAEDSNACKVHKVTEILCTIQNQTRGVVVDIRPRVPHVRANVDAYYSTCRISRPRDSRGSYTFSQEPAGREVWYRYNGGFAPVENLGGWRNPFATCIEVYIVDCREITAAGPKETRPCGDLLEARGFIFEERSE